jgi:surfeit locus 1 family protein
MQGIYVDALPQPGAGYPVGRDATQDIPNNHLSYAGTWFGLAGTLAGVFGYFMWRRRRG